MDDQTKAFEGIKLKTFLPVAAKNAFETEMKIMIGARNKTKSGFSVSAA